MTKYNLRGQLPVTTFIDAVPWYFKAKPHPAVTPHPFGGDHECYRCRSPMSEATHGVIKMKPARNNPHTHTVWRVCPGDFIITHPDRSLTTMRPAAFHEIYESSESTDDAESYIKHFEDRVSGIREERERTAAVVARVSEDIDMDDGLERLLNMKRDDPTVSTTLDWGEYLEIIDGDTTPEDSTVEWPSAGCRPEPLVPDVDEMLLILRGSALGAVYAERKSQDEKWGGPDDDDGVSMDEWVQWIQRYAGWAAMKNECGDTEQARKRMVQTAALAVAAVEWFDRWDGVVGGTEK